MCLPYARPRRVNSKWNGDSAPEKCLRGDEEKSNLHLSNNNRWPATKKNGEICERRGSRRRTRSRGERYLVKFKRDANEEESAVDKWRTAFSRPFPGIFAPFRGHVTSCQSSYRSLDRGERTALLTHLRSLQWSVDWRYFTCKRKTLHLPGCRLDETVNFQNCRRHRPGLISDSPIVLLPFFTFARHSVKFDRSTNPRLAIVKNETLTFASRKRNANRTTAD